MSDEKIKSEVVCPECKTKVPVSRNRGGELVVGVHSSKGEEIGVRVPLCMGTVKPLHEFTDPTQYCVRK